MNAMNLVNMILIVFVMAMMVAVLQKHSDRIVDLQERVTIIERSAN